ncbi:MAG: hypothetical protein HRT99_02890 [Mycoplasmatales bacterium]|nr:hypothetical protein [Mycoplasmatales bacterium]
MILAQNINQSKEVVSWEIKAHQRLTSIANSNTNKEFNIKIVRHLNDDTFDVIVDKGHTGKMVFGGSILVNINNEFEIETNEENPIIHLDKNNQYKFTHGHLKNYKFHEIREIHIAYLSGPIILRKISLKPHFETMNKELIVPVNNLGEIDLVKEFYVEMKGVKHSNHLGLDLPIKEVESESKTKYTKIIYKPTQRNRYVPTYELGEIYLSKNADDQLNKLEIIPKKVITTSNSKGYKEIIDKSISKKEISIGNEEEKYSKYGNLYLNEPTKYDYDKGKTSVGYQENQKKGEIIPYKYRGVYSWNQQMAIKSFKTNFNFITTEFYKYPILNSYDGKVLLKKSTSNLFLDSEGHFLSQDSIKEIRKAENISLEGLKRLSIEKEI